MYEARDIKQEKPKPTLYLDHKLFPVVKDFSLKDKGQLKIKGVINRMSEENDEIAVSLKITSVVPTTSRGE